MKISLSSQYALRSIVKELQNSSSPITKTTLKRSLSKEPLCIEEKEIDAAIDYGVRNKYLEIGDRNYISFRKEYPEISEESYYDTVDKSINNLWKNEDAKKAADFYLENTSKKDSKIVGPWTRPDFTLISHRKFPWTIGTEFDVVTFEVKRPDSCNVLAVFEALSHSSAATKSYVVFPINDSEWEQKDKDHRDRVIDECQRHGVGIIMIENVYSLYAPKNLLKARRREIDHEKCSDFLNYVLSDEGKQRISKWK